MYNTNEIYKGYNDEAAENWEVMPLRDMFQVIANEPKKIEAQKFLAFHKINLSIALKIRDLKKYRNETLSSDYLSRLGAWQHKGKCGVNEIVTFVDDIIRLGIKVPCEMMKEAARIHHEYGDNMAVSSAIEAVYMARGLDTK